MHFPCKLKVLPIAQFSASELQRNCCQSKIFVFLLSFKLIFFKNTCCCQNVTKIRKEIAVTETKLQQTDITATSLTP